VLRDASKLAPQHDENLLKSNKIRRAEETLLRGVSEHVRRPPLLKRGETSHPAGRSNDMKTFTLLQFALFAVTGVAALAALMAAGMAFGFALAGALVLSVLLLIVWMIGVLVVRATRPTPERLSAPDDPDSRPVFASKASRP
jgi:Flp pilus assembly protein TadB